MSTKRYELNRAQWERIAPLLPGKAGDPRRTAADNRLFVNGVLWILFRRPLVRPARALRQLENRA
ncbi:hypothetical protein BH10PSE3_BH10PSE3_42400 [soil metagenome]